MGVAENHQIASVRPTAARLGHFLLPAGLLFLISIAMFWKMTLTNQYTWLDSRDLANQVLPWYQFQAAEWHRGPLPTWDPNHWGGQPLVGQAQPGAAYPPNWLLFLPVRNGWLRQTFLDWYLVLTHYAAALFAYALCRDLGRSLLGALIGASVFALAGWMGSTDWPQMLNGAMWTPLVFLFLLRSNREAQGVRNAAFGGFFLGISWLSGHHQVPIFLSVACGFLWLYFILRNGRPDRTAAWSALTFFGMAAVTGALQILPAIEYGRHAYRWAGIADPIPWQAPVPYTVHEQYSFPPHGLLGVVFPAMDLHTMPYVGITAVALAAVACGVHSEIRTSGFSQHSGPVLCFSRWVPIHPCMVCFIPWCRWWKRLVHPASVSFLCCFSISILSAYGYDNLTNNDDFWWISRWWGSVPAYGQWPWS